MREYHTQSLPRYEGEPKKSLLSVVTPAYNEADNLPLLYERLSQVLDSLTLDWEWIIVDDHSADDTFAAIADLAKQDSRVHGIRFSRNFGSHTAMTCGLHYAQGDCAVIMAADLQDPPETLPDLLTEWQRGAQIVWAVRRRRVGEKASKAGFAQLYYFLMRHVVGMKQMPATGADFFLVDRRVMEALRYFGESNVSIMALITWMGFRQAYIAYDRRVRPHGRSGWSLEKKLKLVLDSLTSFSYLPIRLMSYIGFIVALLGFIYAGFVVVNAIFGHPTPGWSSLMVVVLVLGGMQMLMMGGLGEYLWRALDESRRRPRYIVEATTNIPGDQTYNSLHI
ncbi:glycosyltransferase family 2 protein [Fischerella sp. PCC 9605]|uniref:glycosyltransferase family 2 protein n=1 Tax=Fischerella sp. PCC 9605 TaxID=1173024 RepID=UPI0004B6C451|nr:glycosyltransferase family 2 protein [Fischerella sp. PCC 9605]